MARLKRWMCLACETTHEQFSPFCDACKSTDTITEAPDEHAIEIEQERPRQRAKRATLVSTSLPPVLSTGRNAWDIALGGGFVRPSSVLVYGPRGVGKSTSLLSIANTIGNTLKRPVLYGSAEMPTEH